jgi:hypothetical protein
MLSIRNPKSAIRNHLIAQPRIPNLVVSMDWPIATVLLGTLGTLAVGILKWMPRRDDEGGHIDNGRVYARATDLAEFRARLVSLEQAHHVLRAELRADMKELQQPTQLATASAGAAGSAARRAG